MCFVSVHPKRENKVKSLKQWEMILSLSEEAELIVKSIRPPSESCTSCPFWLGTSWRSSYPPPRNQFMSVQVKVKETCRKHIIHVRNQAIIDILLYCSPIINLAVPLTNPLLFVFPIFGKLNHCPSVQFDHVLGYKQKPLMEEPGIN